MSLGSNKHSLHSLHDEGAEDYISDTLNHNLNQDTLRQPLLPPVDEEEEDYRFDVTNPLYSAPAYIDQTSIVGTLNPALIEDQRCGMSSSRRMFCLLAIFDFGLTFLMWIIYSQVNVLLDMLVLHFTQFFMYSLFVWCDTQGEI